MTVGPSSGSRTPQQMAKQEVLLTTVVLLREAETPLKNRTNMQTETMLALYTTITQFYTAPMVRKPITTPHSVIRTVTFGSSVVRVNTLWTRLPLGNRKWSSMQVSTALTTAAIIRIIIIMTTEPWKVIVTPDVMNVRMQPLKPN